VVWHVPDLGPDLPHFFAFRQGLRDLGYIEGQTVTLDWRYAEQQVDRLGSLVDELIHLGVDALFTPGVLATQAAMRATQTIPIVEISNDPVRTGLVDSLGRPGGNVTGVAILRAGVDAKRVQLLKEAVPGLARVAVLWNSQDPGKTTAVAEVQSAASLLGLEVKLFELHDPRDLEETFQGISEWRGDGFVHLIDQTTGGSTGIEAVALAHRVPGICWAHGFCQRGGLLSYGPDPFALFTNAASYIDRVLKGTRPADLPVQQPQHLELWLNLQTARTLGVSMPDSLLMQADQVIE
jgi:putative ABC transport system substrate-binding protein